MESEKLNKVRFKVYNNERLKKISFHGKDVFPLYVEVGFDRQTIYFKSYYFDLLSKPQYVMRHFTGNKTPVINEVIAKEEKLISFIIEKYNDNFSLEIFKEKYNWYSRDLISPMGEGFIDYLYVFFNDEGLNALATMITLGGNYMSAIVVWKGIRRALKPSLAEKVLKNAVTYAPPYLPFLEAANQKGERNITTLSVFEWESKTFQITLGELLKKKFEDYNLTDVKKAVDELVHSKQ